LSTSAATRIANAMGISDVKQGVQLPPAPSSNGVS